MTFISWNLDIPASGGMFSPCVDIDCSRLIGVRALGMSMLTDLIVTTATRWIEELKY